ncbi:hypothetical protein SGRA_2468 [Saprospira grandis str. Lewin]|uniref:Uncharacterized protein n=1 Tax=Saprospira grandis (strain Lewin) TaxID=984262 RepID=H6L5I0_SAPGL|nr:hypothetical protein SGRA_2468 [Saprospira grandis str. Lewin]
MSLGSKKGKHKILNSLVFSLSFLAGRDKINSPSVYLSTKEQPIKSDIIVGPKVA